MIGDVLHLRRATKAGFAAAGEYFFEKMAVIFFLCRGINQTRIRRRIRG
jgi:hypothetical protein